MAGVSAGPVTLLILVVILLIAVLPGWPYSTTLGFGYYPSGVLGLVLIVIIILLLFGRL